MKQYFKHLYATLFLVLIVTISTYAQKWQWAYSDGNNDSPPEYGSRVLAGNNGDIYFLGTESYSFSSSQGDVVIFNRFIQKRTSDGQFISNFSVHKVKQSNSGASMERLSKDNGSNIFLCGSIYDEYVFDTIKVSGGTDGYIAKINGNNRCEWVKTKRANDVKSVAFDDENNMYITGRVVGNTYIDTFELHNTGSGSLMFIAKLDSNANCLWVKQSFGGNNEFTQVLVSGQYIHTWGYLADTCTVFDNDAYCPTGSFLMQLDMSGKVQWFNSFKKLSGAGGYNGMGVDKNGNSYSTGNFNGIICLGSDTLYKRDGMIEAFLVKHKPGGSVAWHRQIYSDSTVRISCIHTNDEGYTYIAGKFSGKTVFGKDTVIAKPVFNLSRTLDCNMFIARYDADGNYLGVKTVFNAIANDITTDDSGCAIVTGSIHSGTTYFDYIERTSKGNDDYFVAKLSAITGNNNTIKEATLNDKLLIYTNPNSGTFTIEVPASIAANTTAHLQIYNTAGSLIKSETVYISNSTIGVDIGTVQKGLYTVTITGSDAKKFTGKVMVE